MYFWAFCFNLSKIEDLVESCLTKKINFLMKKTKLFISRPRFANYEWTSRKLIHEEKLNKTLGSESSDQGFSKIKAFSFKDRYWNQENYAFTTINNSSKAFMHSAVFAAFFFATTAFFGSIKARLKQIVWMWNNIFMTLLKWRQLSKNFNFFKGKRKKLTYQVSHYWLK